MPDWQRAQKRPASCGPFVKAQDYSVVGLTQLEGLEPSTFGSVDQITFLPLHL
jgi:hypothetical protein